MAKMAVLLGENVDDRLVIFIYTFLFLFSNYEFKGSLDYFHCDHAWLIRPQSRVALSKDVEIFFSLQRQARKRQ